MQSVSDMQPPHGAYSLQIKAAGTRLTFLYNVPLSLMKLQYLLYYLEMRK